jgi:hypothetical protein
MTEAWSKRLLLIAAGWSFLGGGTALLYPSQHFTTLYSTSLSLDDPLQSFFYRCTWISVLGWGGTYLLAALFPASRKSVVIPGAAGKVAFFAACIGLFSNGIGKTALIIAGGVDLLLATLFVIILFSGVDDRGEKGTRKHA